MNFIHKIVLITAIVLFNCTVAFSQIYTGQVLDMNNNCIPYVSIYSLNNTAQGTMSNSEGKFIIKSNFEPEDLICISAIGYKSMTLSFKDLEKRTCIKLKESIYSLNDVVIYSGVGIIKNISKNFKLNYPSNPTLMNVQLKEVSTVNDKYLRYEEYEGLLYVDKYISRYSNPSRGDIKLRINKYRLTDDKKYTADTIDNKLSASSTIGVYLSRLFINKKWDVINCPEDYKISIEGIDYSKINSKGIAKLSFSRYYEQKNIGCNESGFIYVNLDDYAILVLKRTRKFENYKVPCKFEFGNKVVKSFYMPQYATDEVYYTKSNNSQFYEVKLINNEESVLVKDSFMGRYINKDFKVKNVLCNISSIITDIGRLKNRNCVNINTPLKYQFKDRDNKLWDSFSGIPMTSAEADLF